LSIFARDNRYIRVLPVSRHLRVCYIRRRRLLLSQIIWGGFQVRPNYRDQLVHIFPRIISSIVKTLMMSDSRAGTGGGFDIVNGTLGVAEAEAENGSNTSSSYGIVQWSRGARLTRDDVLRAELKLSDDAQIATVVCSGPDERRSDLFFFQVSRQKSSLGVLRAERAPSTNDLLRSDF
jgi:hypothetical protein